MLLLFIFLILLLLYYLGQKSGKKGRKKEYFPLSLPALSLLESFLFSEQNGRVLTGRSGLCSESGSNLQTTLLTQVLLHRSSPLPLPASSYTVRTQEGKAQTGGSSSIQFLPFLPQWKAYWGFIGNGKAQFWDELCILLCLPTWHFTVSYCLYSLNLI